MLSAKIGITAILASAVLIAALVAYIMWQRATLATLRANIAVVEQGLTTEKAAFSSYRAAAERQQAQAQEYQRVANQAQKELSKARGIFEKHNLAALLYAKPNLILKRVNHATDAIVNDISSATGGN